MTTTDPNPIPSTGWNKAEVRADSRCAPTQAFRDHTTRDMQIERVLARFLELPEDAEAIDPAKPGMEPEWLSTDRGACHWCGCQGPRLRYKLDEAHIEYLCCPHEPTGMGAYICLDCWVPLRGDAGTNWNDVACAALDCRWMTWLSHGRMPWLCPSCWKTTATLEAEHLAYLKAEY